MRKAFICVLLMIMFVCGANIIWTRGSNQIFDVLPKGFLSLSVSGDNCEVVYDNKMVNVAKIVDTLGVNVLSKTNVRGGDKILGITKLLHGDERIEIFSGLRTISLRFKISKRVGIDLQIVDSIGVRGDEKT